MVKSKRVQSKVKYLSTYYSICDDVLFLNEWIDKLIDHLIDDFLFFRAVDQLSKLDGARLFAMSRKDLIAAFGKQEGQRLDSQITISRNSAGYQTARTSELRNVLNKARKRSEFNREKYGDGDEAEISVA